MRIFFLVLTALFGIANLVFAYINLGYGGEANLGSGIFNLVVGLVLLVEHGILWAIGDDL